ncbi:MAG TPA: hypothetical protein VMV33_13330 [Rhodocyclaceae bacterium]|nr:hypothetical protein [Rhodocyclaceae bacterium]
MDIAMVGPLAVWMESLKSGLDPDKTAVAPPTSVETGRPFGQRVAEVTGKFKR